MPERRTKIVATLGPASDAPEVLDRLLSVGVDCVRINCSHGSGDQLRSRALAARRRAARAGRPMGLLFDLQGPKLRLSSDTVARTVHVGDLVSFTGSDGSVNSENLVVDFSGFVELVTERSELVNGDGVPRFAVERVEHGWCVVRGVGH